MTQDTLEVPLPALIGVEVIETRLSLLILILGRFNKAQN